MFLFSRRSGPIAALAACLAAAVAAVAATAPAPPNGRYAATLCVANADQPANCGPADVVLRAGGNVRVQVSDIVYQLQLHAGQAAVVVMHGAMQIDEFDAEARWDGGALHFADVEKGLRFEVRVQEPKRPGR
jgi:hypothetical protein